MDLLLQHESRTLYSYILYSKQSESIMTSSKPKNINLPTQAQLRELARYPEELLGDLPEIRDGYHVAEPCSVLKTFRKIQMVVGDRRDDIWRMATNLDAYPHLSEFPGRVKYDEFSIFTQLPFDLRDVIWKMASETNNVIELEWDYAVCRWWSHPARRIAPPGVFSACQESRDCTAAIREKEMVKLFGTYFNIHNDLLFLNSGLGVLNRRFMNFCMSLYAWKGNSEVTQNLPRLAISWNMWDEVLLDGDDDDLSVGGKSGLLRANLTGLKELVLVHVLTVRNQTRCLFEDERILVEEELLDPEASIDDDWWESLSRRHFSNILDPVNERLGRYKTSSERTRKNLKYGPEECKVISKVLYVGGCLGMSLSTSSGASRYSEDEDDVS